jgi:hypothetical protein
MSLLLLMHVASTELDFRIASLAFSCPSKPCVRMEVYDAASRVSSEQSSKASSSPS